MKTILRGLIKWVYGFDLGKIAQYDLQVVDKMPDKPKDNTIYFVKEDKPCQ